MNEMSTSFTHTHTHTQQRKQHLTVRFIVIFTYFYATFNSIKYFCIEPLWMSNMSISLRLSFIWFRKFAVALFLSVSQRNKNGKTNSITMRVESFRPCWWFTINGWMCTHPVRRIHKWNAGEDRNHWVQSSCVPCLFVSISSLVCNIIIIIIETDMNQFLWRPPSTW